jgi:hypothetical protein
MKPESIDAPESWIADLEFEKCGPLRRALKKCITNPFSNYFPAAFQKTALRFMRSELAEANWTDPGGWRSMVISYDRHRHRFADKLLCTLGTIPMALRNRRKLGARVLARLIDASESEPVEVLCLGAGPGQIITDALRECHRKARATLVDISDAAFDYGRTLAARSGTASQVRFIKGDVCDVKGMLDRPPDIVKMLGICEYLTDEQLTHIVGCLAGVMGRGSAIVTNSLSLAHGTDRFFRRVFGLHMIHRTPEELQGFLAPAGFSDFKVLAEPLGVYHILIGRKVR